MATEDRVTERSGKDGGLGVEIQKHGDVAENVSSKGSSVNTAFSSKDEILPKNVNLSPHALNALRFNGGILRVAITIKTVIAIVL